jgi:hypothetical protein
MVVLRSLPKDRRRSECFSCLRVEESLAFELDFSILGNDGEGRLAMFSQMGLGLLKQLAASCVGGFEGDGTGLPFEFLTGVFDLGFDVVESVDGVLESQWNAKGSDEVETTIFGGGNFTFEDECGILMGGGHGNFLVLVRKNKGIIPISPFSLLTCTFQKRA